MDLLQLSILLLVGCKLGACKVCKDIEFIRNPRTECEGQLLTEVPGVEDISKATTYINLRNNKIRLIREDAFQPFEHVAVLDLQRNLITSIDSEAFRGLRYVTQLFLQRNQLRHVPSSVFTDLRGLEILSLAHNPIQTLSADAFRWLERLTTLDLNRCSIQSIDARAFVSTVFLQSLNLKHNKLRALPSQMRDQMSSLNKLDLGGNPLRCDCSPAARQLHAWLQQLRQTTECDGPGQLEGRSMTSLALHQLQCAPRVMNDLYVQNVTLLTNGSAQLICEVCGASSFQWSRGDVLLENVPLTKQCTVKSHNTSEAGVYSCTASNLAGTVMVVYYVVAEEDFQVKIQPVTDVKKIIMDDVIKAERSKSVDKNIIIAGIACAALVILVTCIALPLLILRYRRHVRLLKDNATTKRRLSGAELRSMLSDPTLSPSAHAKARVLSARREPTPEPAAAPLTELEASRDDCDSGHRDSYSADDGMDDRCTEHYSPAVDRRFADITCTAPELSVRASRPTSEPLHMRTPPPKPPRSFQQHRPQTLPRHGEELSFVASECDCDSGQRTSRELGKDPFSSFQPSLI